MSLNRAAVPPAGDDTPPRIDPAGGGLTEQVYQDLLRMVMQNDVKPGSRMVIDKIAADLGVSSTPVREALARLETQGFVTKERLRGYFTTDLMSGAEFDDLWEFRLLVEPYAARRAAARIGGTGRVRLRAEVDGIRGLRLDDDYPSKLAVREHDQRLHDLIFELAENQHARKAMGQAHSHNRMLRVHFTAVDGYRALQEHDDIVAAIVAGDPDAAEEAMRQHVENAYRRLRGYLD